MRSRSWVPTMDSCGQTTPPPPLHGRRQEEPNMGVSCSPNEWPHALQSYRSICPQGRGGVGRPLRTRAVSNLPILTVANPRGAYVSRIAEVPRGRLHLTSLASAPQSRTPPIAVRGLGPSTSRSQHAGGPPTSRALLRRLCLRDGATDAPQPGTYQDRQRVPELASKVHRRRRRHPQGTNRHPRAPCPRARSLHPAGRR